MDILILLGPLVLCTVIGMPIAYALGFSALAGALWVGVPLEAVMLKIADGVGKGAVLTIPLFVLAAALIAEGGTARRLAVLVGFMRGRGEAPAASIVATTLIGGLSGSPVADMAGIGALTIPQMVRAGSPRAFATTAAIAGSVPAALTPPSHNAVIYSLATGGTVSIASLFMAGVVPGLLLCVALMAVCLHLARHDGHSAGEGVPVRAVLRAGIDALWGALTVVVIVGGLLLGLTAVEAAASACVWIFVVSMVVYRDDHWHDLPNLLHRTIKLVAVVLMLIAMAASFAYVMSLTQAPAKITAFLLAVSVNKFIFLLLINVLLLALACLIDTMPLILIATPILLPAAVKFGVDPVHFGTVMLLNLGLGMVTPPIGATLFVGAAVGKVKATDVIRGIGPFYGVMVLALLLVTFVPALSVWLPNLALK